jgi:hypothetical protein
MNSQPVATKSGQLKSSRTDRDQPTSCNKIWTTQKVLEQIMNSQPVAKKSGQLKRLPAETYRS